MLRFVILIQGIIYLIVMPLAHQSSEFGYFPPVTLGVLTCAALVAGMMLGSSSLVGASSQSTNINQFGKFQPRNFAVFAFFLALIPYAYVSWTNGLINRRQGSEVMADIYGNLPIYELLILRLFEIGFIPIGIIIFYGRSKAYAKILLVLTIVLATPFMGLQDSRGRLLVFAIYFISFLSARDLIVRFYNNIVMYLFGALAFVAFWLASAQRILAYSSFSDFIYSEIIIRLDGLKLATQLRESGLLNYLGSYDWGMFAPLIAKIPFLEEGRIAKIQGITSTKQYYLKILLRTDQIDDSNSLMLDPLYFSGIFGLIVAFILLGYASSRFDNFIAAGRLFASRVKLALAIAFVTSFATFEVDFVGALTTLLQNFIIAYLLSLVALRPTAESLNPRVSAIG